MVNCEGGGKTPPRLTGDHRSKRTHDRDETASHVPMNWIARAMSMGWLLCGLASWNLVDALKGFFLSPNFAAGD